MSSSKGEKKQNMLGGLLFHWSLRLFVIVTSAKDGIHAVYQTEAKMSVDPFSCEPPRDGSARSASASSNISQVGPFGLATDHTRARAGPQPRCPLDVSDRRRWENLKISINFRLHKIVTCESFCHGSHCLSL